MAAEGVLTLGGRVAVHVSVVREHGEVAVDLEAELGGACEEGEGSFGRVWSGPEVGVRHIASVGLGSIAWLEWWEVWREGVRVIWVGGLVAYELPLTVLGSSAGTSSSSTAALR